MNIINQFTSICKKYSDKTAFFTDLEKITFGELELTSKKIGSGLLNKNINGLICIYTNKGIETICAMLGVLYSGSTYVILDNAQPIERILKILEIINPQALIYDNSLKIDNLNIIKDKFNSTSLVEYAQLTKQDINEELLYQSTSKIISTSPAYILFTSGSTGTPKGTVVSHNNVLSYIDWVAEEFNFNEKTIFGNQAPFYFSMSITDVYSTLLRGCSLYIIPKSYFSFPIKLIEAMNKYQINTIYWVPSAYAIVANLKILNYALPEYLNQCLFAGEVMMMRILNIWRKALPHVKYANLFGPTETTDICTFYKVNREFNDDDALPIGNACQNLDVMLIDEEGNLVTHEGSGELYCRGAFVALGYYNNPEKTATAFVQNPLNKSYPEIVYRTGDICKYNEYGELMYLSRRDFQIKHAGYRIELGEIEVAVNAIDGILNAFCLYNAIHDQIILVYEGKATTEEIIAGLQQKVPNYMLPNKTYREKKIIYNQNGKIDRKYYQKLYGEN